MSGKRIFAALLAVLLVLSSGLPARAASNPELPDLSAFLGSKYTQNVEGTYTYYVTCTYSEDLGTGPLEEFLELLQEDRYQLELTNTSKEYQDSWDPAGTCKDYFFEYTGSDSRITSITTSDGYVYDARVTLYTYSNKDYNAIVFYREKDFVLVDSGVHLGDREKKTIPALSDFFGDALRKEAGNGETAYFFEFSSLPNSCISDFGEALKKLELEKTGLLGLGTLPLQFLAEDTVVITLRWYEADKELKVTLHDDALKEAGYSCRTTNVGEEPAPQPKPNTGCSNCGGDGEINCYNCIDGACFYCGGDGYVYRFKPGRTDIEVCGMCRLGRCNVCKGDGKRDCAYCG